MSEYIPFKNKQQKELALSCFKGIFFQDSCGVYYHKPEVENRVLSRQVEERTVKVSKGEWSIAMENSPQIQCKGNLALNIFIGGKKPTQAHNTVN